MAEHREVAWSLLQSAEKRRRLERAEGGNDPPQKGSKKLHEHLNTVLSQALYYIKYDIMIYVYKDQEAIEHDHI